MMHVKLFFTAAAIALGNVIASALADVGEDVTSFNRGQSDASTAFSGKRLLRESIDSRPPVMRRESNWRSIEPHSQWQLEENAHGALRHNLEGVVETHGDSELKSVKINAHDHSAAQPVTHPLAEKNDLSINKGKGGLAPKMSLTFGKGRKRKSTHKENNSKGKVPVYAPAPVPPKKGKIVWDGGAEDENMGGLPVDALVQKHHQKAHSVSKKADQEIAGNMTMEVSNTAQWLAGDTQTKRTDAIKEAIADQAGVSSDTVDVEGMQSMASNPSTELKVQYDILVSTADAARILTAMSSPDKDTMALKMKNLLTNLSDSSAISVTDVSAIQQDVGSSPSPSTSSDLAPTPSPSAAVDDQLGDGATQVTGQAWLWVKNTTEFFTNPKAADAVSKAISIVGEVPENAVFGEFNTGGEEAEEAAAAAGQASAETSENTVKIDFEISVDEGSNIRLPDVSARIDGPAGKNNFTNDLENLLAEDGVDIFNLTVIRFGTSAKFPGTSDNPGAPTPPIGGIQGEGPDTSEQTFGMDNPLMKPNPEDRMDPAMFTYTPTTTWQDMNAILGNVEVSYAPWTAANLDPVLEQVGVLDTICAVIGFTAGVDDDHCTCEAEVEEHHPLFNTTNNKSKMHPHPPGINENSLVQGDDGSFDFALKINFEITVDATNTNVTVDMLQDNMILPAFVENITSTVRVDGGIPPEHFQVNDFYISEIITGIHPSPKPLRQPFVDKLGQHTNDNTPPPELPTPEPPPEKKTIEMPGPNGTQIVEHANEVGTPAPLSPSPPIPAPVENTTGLNLSANPSPDNMAPTPPTPAVSEPAPTPTAEAATPAPEAPSPTPIASPTPAAPTPAAAAPTPAAPTPAAAAPTPAAAAPTPAAAAPTPAAAAPTPAAAAPTPAAAAPTPAAAAPTPAAAAPTPAAAAPTPAAAAPTPAAAAPTPAAAAPTPAAAAPTPAAAASPTPAASNATAPAAAPTPAEAAATPTPAGAEPAPAPAVQNAEGGGGPVSGPIVINPEPAPPPAQTTYGAAHRSTSVCLTVLLAALGTMLSHVALECF